MCRSIFKLLLVLLAFAVFSCAGVSKKEKEATAHFKVGVSYLLKGQTQAAYVKFHEAFKLDPDNREIHNALGNVYLQLEDYDNAEKHFLEAADIDDEYSEAYNNLCYVYYREGKYEKAIKRCEKALENPLYSTPDKAFYNMGRSYHRLARYPEAVDAFNNAVKRFPNFFQAYYGLALAYNARKMYGKAAEAMGYAVGFDPRFRGDAAKAEREFLNQQAEGKNLKDLPDYIEILHY